jgi:hypothetical protein
MRAITLSALVLLASCGVAHAQGSPTEQYVPIGKTPAKTVMQGELVSVAPQPQSTSATAGATTAFTMTTGGAERVYLIGPHTRIYLDRSSQGLTNQLGSVSDLRSGRYIEAFVPNLASGMALWVKVRSQ